MTGGVEYSGDSYGNVVVSGGMVFIGTNNEGLRDRDIKDDKGVLMAFRESDGAFMWQMVHDKLVAGRVNDGLISHLCSPALAIEQTHPARSTCVIMSFTDQLLVTVDSAICESDKPAYDSLNSVHLLSSCFKSRFLSIIQFVCRSSSKEITRAHNPGPPYTKPANADISSHPPLPQPETRVGKPPHKTAPRKPTRPH